MNYSILASVLLYVALISVSASRQLLGLYEHAFVVLQLVFFLGYTFCLYFVFRNRSDERLVSNRLIFAECDPLLTIRSLACFMVIMQHGFGISLAPTHLREYLFKDSLWLLLPSAWVGVWVFFLLSGYLMAKGFIYRSYTLDKNVWGFFKNRLIKIYPGYIVVLMIASIFITPAIFDIDNVWLLISILLFSYDGTFQINPVGALWSICTEMQFYLIVPLISLYLIKCKPSKLSCFYIFLILAIFGLIYRKIGYIDNGYYWKTAVMTSVLGNLDLFLSGSLLAYIVYNSEKVSIKPIVATLSLLLIYLVSAYFVSQIVTGRDYLGSFAYYGPSLTLIFTFLTIYVYEISSKHFEVYDPITKRIVQYTQVFGLLTYNIYLAHEPIQRILNRYLINKYVSVAESIGLLFVSTLFAVLLAKLLEITVDKYFSKLRYRRLN